MAAPRRSTAAPRTPPRKASNPSAGPNAAAASKKPVRPLSTRGRTKVAEMLRDLQIDGKALSVQIERLRHRFL